MDKYYNLLGLQLEEVEKYLKEKRIEERTGIKVIVAEEPLSCVAAGTGKALSSIDLLKSGGIFNRK